MALLELQASEFILSEEKALVLFRQLDQIRTELSTRELADPTLQAVNGMITEINTSGQSGKPLQKQLKDIRTKLLKLLEKELKLVPRHHYRTQWMVLGMSAFGIPIGVAFGMSIGNLGMLGLGLPIGMAIGVAVGSGMDEKAKKEGRQLNFTVEG